MRHRRLLWLLFPIFGSLSLLLFRPSETDWRGENTPPEQRPEIRDGFAKLDSFWIAVEEISAEEVRRVLQEEIASLPNGVACVSLDQAKRYCSATNTRLPTETEWERAARGNTVNAPYPWGWGPVPAPILFSRTAPPESRGPAMPNGLKDMAGGVWEWTDEGVLKGGAWSERGSEVLRIASSRTVPETYSGKDVGFRVIRNY